MVVGDLPPRVAYGTDGGLFEKVIAQIERLSSAPLERNLITERVVAAHLRAIDEIVSVDGKRPRALPVREKTAPAPSTPVQCP